jgi:3-oxoadipate enol-lactonase
LIDRGLPSGERRRDEHRASGRGEPVVLLSDIGEDLTSWSYQASSFGSLHFLLQLDNRGTGWSDCPGDDCPIGTLANDVLCAMDLVGIDNTHLVGLGREGMIAQEIAIRRPGRVNGLVLASTSTRATVQQRLIYDAWVRSGMDDVDHNTISRFMVPWLYSSWFLTHDKWREFGIRAQVASYRWTSWEDATAQHGAMLGFDSIERLSTINSPTLVLSGSVDPLTPPSSADELTTGIGNARGHNLKAGHLLHIELPKTLNKIVLGFLAEVEGSPTPDLGPGIPLPCGGLGI